MAFEALCSSGVRRSLFGAIALAGLAATGAVFAAVLDGQVLGGGAPIAGSAVTLWAASAGAPKQLAQTQTGADGRFSMTARRGRNGHQPVSRRTGGSLRPTRRAETTPPSR